MESNHHLFTKLISTSKIVKEESISIIWFAHKEHIVDNIKLQRSLDHYSMESVSWNTQMAKFMKVTGKMV